MREFGFERLEAWKSARALVREVYELTERLPRSETYGLAGQLNRAVVSVACNLAEGSARISGRDQAHFSQLAYSSLMETACLLLLCEDLGCVDHAGAANARLRIQGLAAGIDALRKTQLARSPAK